MNSAAGLEAFFQARGRPLYRYAYALCLNEADAQDLVQEALARTFGFGRRIDPDSPAAESYVKTVMLRLFIDGSRRGRRWASVQHLLAAREDEPDRAPDDTLDSLDLGTAMAALPPRQRACVLLYYYDDQPVAVIAQRLRINEGNVKRTLSDARARLRGLLSPEAATND